MRDLVVGMVTLVGLGLLGSGGLAWYRMPAVDRTSKHGVHDAIPHAGAVFVRFWLAGACFFGGAVLLATHRNRRGGTAAPPEGGTGCAICRQERSETCVYCGEAFCTVHGGQRWCWATDADDSGISMARRPVCVQCTPSPARMRWSVMLGLLFMIAVITGLGFGWLTFRS
ncbi:MAG: hypothetical protein U0840_02700 [Gemmataceae bacterium]